MNSPEEFIHFLQTKVKDDAELMELFDDMLGHYFGFPKEQEFKYTSLRQGLLVTPAVEYWEHVFKA